MSVNTTAYNMREYIGEMIIQNLKHRSNKLIAAPRILILIYTSRRPLEIFTSNSHTRVEDHPSITKSVNQQGKDISGNTWKSESCSLVNFVVKVCTTTALLSSCNFWTEASALFLPTSFSEKIKLLDKSHSSTFPSSCKVTDFTPARMRFFAANQKVR